MAPAGWRTSVPGKFLLACFHLPDRNWYRLRVGWAGLAQTVRLYLMASGLPLKRQYLIVRCLDGDDAAGLFSEFITVLGALAHYSRWEQHYAGLQVDFGDQGLYYDATVGPNWWEYHFVPTELGSRDDACIKVSDLLWSDLFSQCGERLPRDRAAELVRRYIRPKPHICEKVDTYVRHEFDGCHMIGVHYRGTDKHEEAPRVSYESVHVAIRDAIDAAPHERYKIFVATDEQAFLDCMNTWHPGRLLYRPMFRSADGIPIDVVNEDGNYRKGEDAVIDCLLLARTNVLIRTASALSDVSTFFGPEVPVTLLGQEA